jgi:hypothetical protein
VRQNRILDVCKQRRFLNPIALQSFDEIYCQGNEYPVLLEQLIKSASPGHGYRPMPDASRGCYSVVIRQTASEVNKLIGSSNHAGEVPRDQMTP